MQHHQILRVVTKFYLPLILLFGLYVLFPGDYGPGGGFPAGVIGAGALFLFALVLGFDMTPRVAPPGVLRVCSAAGVLIYLGTGAVNMLLGSDFLDYGSFVPEHPSHGEHYGILAVELGVGLAVASTLLLIFFAFAGRSESKGTD